jgi:hypothetical protein
MPTAGTIKTASSQAGMIADTRFEAPDFVVVLLLLF